jgi:hypothetical protein
MTKRNYVMSVKKRNRIRAQFNPGLLKYVQTVPFRPRPNAQQAEVEVGAVPDHSRQKETWMEAFNRAVSGRSWFDQEDHDIRCGYAAMGEHLLTEEQIEALDRHASEFLARRRLLEKRNRGRLERLANHQRSTWAQYLLGRLYFEGAIAEP